MKVKPNLTSIEVPSDLRRQAVIRLMAQGFMPTKIAEKLPGIPYDTIVYWMKDPEFMKAAHSLMLEMTSSPLDFFAPRLQAAFAVLDKALDEGDINAARDVWAYSFGKPKQADSTTNSPRITIVFKNREEPIIEAEFVSEEES